MKIQIVAMILFVIWPCRSLASDELRICVDDWHPYEFFKNDRAGGLYVEVVSAVLARMGHAKPEYVNASWSRCLESVEAGKLHAAVSALKTSERTDYAHYPQEPLGVSRWVLFARNDRIDLLGFKRLFDLDGDSIGVVKGFYYPPDFLRYAKEHTVLHYATTTLLNFQMLLDKRLDYVLDDLIVGRHIVRSLDAQEVIVPILDVEISSEPLYIMFSKRNMSADFVEKFSLALYEFKGSERYEEIMSRYE